MNKFIAKVAFILVLSTHHYCQGQAARPATARAPVRNAIIITNAAPVPPLGGRLGPSPGGNLGGNPAGTLSPNSPGNLGPGLGARLGPGVGGNLNGNPGGNLNANPGG